MKKFLRYLLLYSLFMFITALTISIAFAVMGIGNPVPDSYVIPTLVTIVVIPVFYTLLWERLSKYRPRL